MKLLVGIMMILAGTAMAGAPAWAQMDPSAWISNSGSASNAAPTAASAASSDDGLETHRYVKKHKPLRKNRDLANEDGVDSLANESGNGTANGTINGPVNGAANRNAKEANETTSGSGPEADLQNSQIAPLPRLEGDTYSPQAVPQPIANSPSVASPTFGNRVRDLFFGGDPEMIDQYRSFLDSGDIRKNVFEFTVAGSYLYDTSMSPYYFRNYIDSAPAAFVGLDLWITPFIGIDTDYRSTLLDTVSDSPAQTNFVSANHTWFDLGVHFRRFFGMAMNSSSLTIGLRYADYVFSVPTNAQTHMGIHNEAPELTIDSTIPSGRNFSWTAGLSLQPYVNQTETIGNVNLQSGQSNQTVEFGANLGGEYRMSRQTRIFFKCSVDVMKSQFSGIANGIDPVTGVSPTNVPVTDVFYMFDLGLKLGR